MTLENVQPESSFNDIRQCFPSVSKDLEFDVCVTGTSVTECMIAASLALLGLRVLHLESFSFYGKHSGSVSLSDLLNFLNVLSFERTENQTEKKAVNENVRMMFCNPYFKWNPFKKSGVNEEEEEDNYIKGEIQKKRFIIDIHPRILFSNDLFTSTIINSGASQYIEFCNVNTDNVVVNEARIDPNRVDSCESNGLMTPLSFEPTLQSKSAIFQNKNLCLIEKRLAMKFITCYLLPCIKNLIEKNDNMKNQQLVENRQNGLTKQFLSASVVLYNKNESPFIQDTTLWDTVMRQLNVPSSVQIRLTYGFGLKSSRAVVEDGKVQNAWTFRTACDRFKRIALSVGRYSESPYLYPVYGSGDISQGFCRICAVYKGVYMLSTHIVGLLEKPFNDKDAVENQKKARQGVDTLQEFDQAMVKDGSQVTLLEPQEKTEPYKTLLLSNSLHANVRRVITSCKQFRLEMVSKLAECNNMNMVHKTFKLLKENENMVEYIRCVAILSTTVLPEASSQYGANFCVFISKTSSPVHLLELQHMSGCTDPNYVLLHMTQRLNRDEDTLQEPSLDSECPKVYSKLQTLLKHLLANTEGCQCFFVGMWTEQNELCENPFNSDDPDIIYVPSATQMNTSLYLEEAEIATQIVEKVWKNFHKKDSLNLMPEKIHIESSLKNDKEMLKKSLLERVERFVINVSNIQSSNT